MLNWFKDTQVGHGTPQVKIQTWINESQLEALDELAYRLQLSRADLIEDIFEAGFQYYADVYQTRRLWHSLSQRQKQITALACRGHTNKEMASVLSISVNTVKTHLSLVLEKCDVTSKDGLMTLFEGWDFASWQGLE